MKQVKLLAAVFVLLLPASALADALWGFQARDFPLATPDHEQAPHFNFDGFNVPPANNFGCEPAAEYVGSAAGFTLLHGGWRVIAENLMCTSILSCVEIAQNVGGFTAAEHYRPAQNQMFRILRREMLHRRDGTLVVQVLVDQPNSAQYGACRAQLLINSSRGEDA